MGSNHATLPQFISLSCNTVGRQDHLLYISTGTSAYMQVPYRRWNPAGCFRVCRGYLSAWTTTSIATICSTYYMRTSSGLDSDPIVHRPNDKLYTTRLSKEPCLEHWPTHCCNSLFSTISNARYTVQYCVFTKAREKGAPRAIPPLPVQTPSMTKAASLRFGNLVSALFSVYAFHNTKHRPYITLGINK